MKIILMSSHKDVRNPQKKKAQKVKREIIGKVFISLIVISLILIPVIGCDGPTQQNVIFEKQVWDPDTHQWVEEIEAQVCTNVRFSINITNWENYGLTNVIVVDTLPDCLEYVPGGISEWANYMEIVGNELTWNFSGGPVIAPDDTLYIDFYAHVISAGVNENCANFTATTPQGEISDTDCATVIGEPYESDVIWVANSESDNVMKIDTNDNVLGPYQVGSYPRALAFDGTNIWVANSWDNEVMTLDTNGNILDTCDVSANNPPTHPSALAFDGTNIWVANVQRANVMKLDTNGNILDTYDVGGGPCALAFDETNIWVCNFRDDNVMKLDTNGNILYTYDVGSAPYALVVEFE